MDVAKYPSVWYYVDKYMDGSQIAKIQETVYEDAFFITKYSIQGRRLSSQSSCGDFEKKNDFEER